MKKPVPPKPSKTKMRFGAPVAKAASGGMMKPATPAMSKKFVDARGSGSGLDGYKPATPKPTPAAAKDWGRNMMNQMFGLPKNPKAGKLPSPTNPVKNFPGYETVRRVNQRPPGARSEPAMGGPKNNPFMPPRRPPGTPTKNTLMPDSRQPPVSSPQIGPAMRKGGVVPKAGKPKGARSK